MFSRVYSCGLLGLDGYLTEIETDVSNGLPTFEIVGLADAAVREARERVRAAIRNSGCEYPLNRLVVSLAPADMRKEGTAYDLPIAIGILAACGCIPPASLAGTVLIGELALDGGIRPTNGVLCRVLAARERGFRMAVVPSRNAGEAAVVEGVEIYAAEDLASVLDHLCGRMRLPVCHTAPRTVSVSGPEGLCFSQVRGQAHAKRALEICAAGGHNVLLVGSAGSGKTMLARRLPTILPELSFDEALEITRIYSVAGLLPQGATLLSERPFRDPHHTISCASLVGGGSRPKPGEISLAHLGVLFLDELPEFGRSTLDVMRQPVEEGVVRISRVHSSVEWPCRFMLAAAANPCKCGNYGDPLRTCTCPPRDAEAYLSRLSGPLMDRVDLQVQVPTQRWSEFQEAPPGESSADILARVREARRRQLERYGGACRTNAGLNATEIRRHCALGADCRELLRQAFDRLGLSARAHDRILKVARTIADLAGEEEIRPSHVAEAIQYRALDRLGANRPSTAAGEAAR